ncbi:DUF1329 domain-containing protein [Uliginosibacterium sediminicola]|uniref:DUF1329 domain-containing protein n=1 Tax=Uliginosibacterium sediminicola TaxID=2024550 RepID=A0ABU9YZS7_9RHOO
MKFQESIAIALLGTLIGMPAYGAVSADEAAKLKTTLTPMGAERAANKDGSIPAWTGGYTKVPAGYKSGTPRPDFYADDKLLYSVDAKNMDKYVDKLSDGVKGLLKKYPDFKLNVYPTHRSAAAPQWVYDNTFQNATRAKLTDEGFGVSGAYGGIPFPIPQNGNEVMWNHILAWKGESASHPSRCWMVTADGNISLVSEGEQNSLFPYYDRKGSLESFKGFYQYGRYVQSAPASKAGEAILVHETTDAAHARGIWQYLVGQRRVRRAPSVSYDTPDSVTSGMGFFDEAFMQFGPFDRHQYKLIGKKELLIPYNNNRAASAKPEDLIGKNFLNPQEVRWELHRVWEVEATLAPGKRHVVAKRKYYFDEDSWQIILLDGWDAQGQLWRMSYTLTVQAPEVPAIYGNVYWGTYNLLGGGYYLNAAANGLNRQASPNPQLTEKFFSPEELANLGAR